MQSADIFAQNMELLIARNHTISSLSRDLNIHRNQLQRFVDGTSVPKPDVLHRICLFFGVDARILTNSLETLYRRSHGTLPDYLLTALDPVPQDMLPDGFYSEWRELQTAPALFVRETLHIKTINGVRQTKIKMNRIVILPDGSPKEIEGRRTVRGVALRQAGGLCIIDQCDYDNGLTFTALRSGIHGDANLFGGHKRSVRSVLGSDLLRKSATVLQRLQGGYPEAVLLRRQPRLQTSDEIPELIQWLLREQQATLEFD